MGVYCSYFEISHTPKSSHGGTHSLYNFNSKTTCLNCLLRFPATKSLIQSILRYFYLYFRFQRRFQLVKEFTLCPLSKHQTQNINYLNLQSKNKGLGGKLSTRLWFVLQIKSCHYRWLPKNQLRGVESLEKKKHLQGV